MMVRSFKATARSGAIVLAALGCLLPGEALAIPLLNGFGGPTGYGLPQNCVHPNDDGSYSGPPGMITAPVALPLTTAFPNGVNFFGNVYRTFYLNTNGNITFRAALGTYTPAAFPIADQPIAIHRYNRRYTWCHRVAFLQTCNRKTRPIRQPVRRCAIGSNYQDCDAPHDTAYLVQPAHALSQRSSV